MDTLTFDAFIAQKLGPKLWKGAVIIIDHCSIHKSEEIEALISSFGATLIYLPPISRISHPLRTTGPKSKVFFGRSPQELIRIYSPPWKIPFRG